MTRVSKMLCRNFLVTVCALPFFCLLGAPCEDRIASDASKVDVLRFPAEFEASDRTYKVAVLMINTLVDPVEDDERTKKLEFYTPKQLGELFFNHPDGCNAFLREASYGRVAIEGTVVGWLNAPKAGLDSTDILAQSDDYFGLASEHIRFSEYDIFIVHALVDGRGQQTGWLYPQQSINTPQGRINNIGITWMINSAVFDDAPLARSNWSSGDAVLPTTSWAHELLHTFGITGHANSYDSGEETLATSGTENPIRPYGGVFSIMGEHAFGTHPDVLMKSRLGWLKPNQFPTIDKSGVYEIYPLATPEPDVKGLLIPVSPAITHSDHSVNFDAFFLEYRTPVGFDRYIERLEGSPFLEIYKPEGQIDRHGVAIYLKYGSSETDGTVLLDANPASSFNPNRGIKTRGNVGKFADAILPVDETFNYDDKILITPLGVTPQGAMRVRIDLRP